MTTLLAIRREKTAVMGGDDTIDDRQTETRTATLTAESEEGFEDVLPCFGRDPRTVVGNLQNGPSGSVLDPDGDSAAAFFDRVPCVDDQVEQHPTQTDRVGDDRHRLFLEIDLKRAEVSREGKPVELSALEFKLLAYFVEHRGDLLTRKELLERVWGHEALLHTRTVDVHVAWLRQKLEANPSHPQFITTIHRRGYKFNA